MISDEKVERALAYLAETDEKLGQLIGANSGMDHLIKADKGNAFLESEESSIGARQADADRAPEVMRRIDEQIEVRTELEIIRAKRKRAELTIMCWQTMSANQRRGHI